MDSVVAVTLVMDFNSLLHPLAHLITACQELLRRDWICSFSHVYREKNRVDDVMAELGHEFDIGLHVEILEKVWRFVIVGSLLTSEVGTTPKKNEREP
ncbi:hypothetical protein ACFX2I_028568 [Malus domestica]